MSITIITFKIADPIKHKSCQEYIMQDDHLKINESSFLVRNSKAIDMIRREIVDFFDKTDELFIGKIHKNDWTSWHLGKKRRDWIEEFVERS